MKKHTTFTAIPTAALKAGAVSGMSASCKLLCLAAGIKALKEMMEEDAKAA
jgi:hypothetical protein